MSGCADFRRFARDGHGSSGDRLTKCGHVTFRGRLMTEAVSGLSKWFRKALKTQAA